MPAQSTTSLSWSRILLYGIGEIPVTVTMVLFGLFLVFFYNSVLGLSAPLIGVGFGAGLVLDAMLDPWIGFQSDYTRHRLGRRRPFIFAGAVTMGLCFALIFSPPQGLGKPGLFCWLLICSILYRFTAAVYRIPYLSLGAELTQDYDQRTIIMAVRAICGLAGALLGALSFVLFFRNGTTGDPKLEYAHYPYMGFAFGALLTVAGLAAFFGTAGHRDPAGVSKRPRSPNFFKGFGMTMSNLAFRSVWLSFTLFYAAVIMNASLALNFFTWSAGIRDAGALSTAQATFGLGACGGVVLWMAVAKRGEKRTWYSTGIFGTALLLVSASLLIGDGKPLGFGKAWPLIGGYAIAGILASALWVLPPSMVADVADQDNLITGSRREGVYFGVLNFGEKIASAIAVLVGGFFLQYYVRLEPQSTTQTADTVSRLGILYGLVPGAMLLGSILLILPYSLDRAKLRDIQRQLSERALQASLQTQRSAAER